ncbi:MAG: hypothetical protein WBE96_19465, partial [Pseudolabrys sp.]
TINATITQNTISIAPSIIEGFSTNGRFPAALTIARQPHLIEQDGFQSAAKSIYWRLRRLKIFSFTRSADRTGVFLHGSDRTHVLINVR